MSEATKRNIGQEIKELLAAGEIATKEVVAFGSQVHITCRCRKTAEKVARIMQAGGFTLGRLFELLDYAKKNKGTCLRPTMVRVWRVWMYVK